MQRIIDFIYGIVYWFYALVLAVINTIVAMFQDLFCWLFDQILAVAVYVLGLLNFDFLIDGSLAAAFDGLPATVWNVFWLLGLPYCLALVVSAIGIRLILQLIPFTRLGS